MIPTKPFTILDAQDQEIGETYVVQERRATDFEALKLWKSSSGYFLIRHMFLLSFTNHRKDLQTVYYADIYYICNDLQLKRYIRDFWKVYVFL